MQAKTHFNILNLLTLCVRRREGRMPRKKKDRSEVKEKTIGVKCTIDQHGTIVDKAKAHGLKPATYLRNLALNYPITSTIDSAAFHELIKTRGDLGRLGGLLKLYLSDKDKAAYKNRELVKKLLIEIDMAKVTLLEQAKRIKK